MNPPVSVPVVYSFRMMEEKKRRDAAPRESARFEANDRWHFVASKVIFYLFIYRNLFIAS